jgi:hypothetical protein
MYDTDITELIVPFEAMQILSVKVDVVPKAQHPSQLPWLRIGWIQLGHTVLPSKLSGIVISSLLPSVLLLVLVTTWVSGIVPTSALS